MKIEERNFARWIIEAHLQPKALLAANIQNAKGPGQVRDGLFE
jgi:hypothetical protein